MKYANVKIMNALLLKRKRNASKNEMMSTKKKLRDGDSPNNSSDSEFMAIADRFTSLKEVSHEIQKEGIESCGLIFGIDYTTSNKVQGMKTFNGWSLHDTRQQKANPYQQVISILGETLEPFDDDGIIPAYGFGDFVTKDKDIFPLKVEGECEGFCDVLDVYNERTPNIRFGGPTNFAPLIEKAIEIVKETKQYHILVIVADGQVTSEDATVNAIVQASKYPLSIVLIGVGDGPWERMEEFDDELPDRKFDNFQFVNFHKTVCNARNPEAAVALAALMEIPDQYKAIKRLKLLDKVQ